MDPKKKPTDDDIIADAIKGAEAEIFDGATEGRDLEEMDEDE